MRIILCQRDCTSSKKLAAKVTDDLQVGGFCFLLRGVDFRGGSTISLKISIVMGISLTRRPTLATLRSPVRCARIFENGERRALIK